MARIRTIKPEFWGDEKLAPLPAIARLVFLGLISMADDAGRVVDSIRAIDGFVFPETEDTARDALEVLIELGRLERGVTESGQRILQIVNWSHQKIDKPNMAAALPPIAVLDEASSNRRRAIPAKLRDAIFARDGGVCRSCSTTVRKDKRDKYDADPDLAEIDHIRPVVDGGTNDPQNLQLYCLSCNRKKAGEDVRRRNTERSPTDRRDVGDMSAPHINDLRSTNNDHLSASDEQAARAPEEEESSSITAEAFRSHVGTDWPDVRRFLESRKGSTRPEWIREMFKITSPGSQFTTVDLAGACADALMLDEPLTGPHALRTFIAKRALERNAPPRKPPGSSPPNGSGNSTSNGGRAALIFGKIRDLITESQAPGQALRRSIPRAKVAVLGEDVAQAYDAIGGAERVLSANGEQMGFVIRDFTAALAAHAEVSA